MLESVERTAGPSRVVLRARWGLACALAFGVWECTASAAPVPIDYLVGLSVDQIEADYAAHKYTVTELTQAYLNRIAIYEPVYNAYVTMNTHVLQDAAALDAQMAAPGFVMPALFGVPTAIKDPMNVAGMRTTAGSSYFGTTTDGPGGVVAPGAVEMIPDTDSAQVARLRAAGVVILGKTNICDFALTGSNSNSTLNGNTHNAYDWTRTPGGSSGGSAVAVATAMAAIATAEETGSSITNPSSAASIVGIKPTFGTIPSSGVFPLTGYFRDTDGTFGKTVRDAARMFDVEAGPSYQDPKPSPAFSNIPPGGFVKYIDDHPHAISGSRIGVFNLNGLGFSTTKVTNSETIALFNNELNLLQAHGATLVADPFVGTAWQSLMTGVPSANTFGYDVEQYLATLGPGAAFHSIEEYNALYSAASGKTWFQIPGMPSGGNGISFTQDPATRADLDPYRIRRDQIDAFFKYIMDTYDLDALVLPQLAAPVGTLPNGGISRTPGSAPNIMGTPGITIPGGYYADGTPFQMYFIGQLNDDAHVIALGADYESFSEHRIAPTLLTAVPVPEPASVGLLAVGIVGLTGRRRSYTRG